jgi:miniconductance mechanosensitive channel
MEEWPLLLKNEYFIEFIKLLCLILVAIIGFYGSRKIILPLIHKFLKRTQVTWDDLLTDHKVFGRLMLLIPAMIIHYGLPLVPEFYEFLSKTIQIYVYFVIIAILNSFLDAFVAIYGTRPMSYKWPLKGWGQLLKMFVTILGGVFIIALILDKSPWGLVSSIGAMTAILLLIFKDTLLSFVASLQIASYNLIRVGDWIEMPAFGVDGDVVDISLHTVKVQNFDKTSVSVPTHKFLDHSFKNWRGMYEADGRRIKRSILIDQSSITFLDQNMLETLKNAEFLKDYLSKKQKEISNDNQNHAYSSDSPLNGRRLTNLGTFRAYVLEYLNRNPHVRKDLTLIVRHLQPEANKGLPLEIYCFINDTRWNQYESIQADIFDHILAAMPFFGLRTYQRNALMDNRV